MWWVVGGVRWGVVGNGRVRWGVVGSGRGRGCGG